MASFSLKSAFLIVTFASLAVVGCRHREPRIVAPNPPAGLIERADELARDASADQHGQPVENSFLFGVAYQEDDVKDWELRLDAKHCYWFGAAGESTVERISLYLWDPHEKSVAKGRSGRSTSTIAYCPTESGRYHMRGKVNDGYGHFAVATYASGAPEKAAPAPAPALTVEALIEEQAKSIAGAERVGAYYEGKGEKTDWFMPLDAGACYWFIGAGEPNKVSKLSMYLWGPKDKRITENYGESNTTVLGYCATEPGMYRFQAKVTSGNGSYKAAVYKKKS